METILSNVLNKSLYRLKRYSDDKEIDTVLHDSINKISQIVSTKDSLKIFDDEFVLEHMTVGNLAIVLEDYFTTRASTEVILRMHADAKILTREFVRLLLNTDEFQDKEVITKNFFDLTLKEYFFALEEESSEYAISVYNMIYNLLIAMYDIDEEMSLYEILIDSLQTLDTPYANGQNEQHKCFLLFILPIALYMRYNLQTDISKAIESADCTVLKIV